MCKAMSIKAKTSNTTTSSTTPVIYAMRPTTSLRQQQRTARRVLKKYKEFRKAEAAHSYKKLKKLVPAIKSKDNISKLDVILEAISYIQRLQYNLVASTEDCSRKH